jgi:hypothetical protein
MNQAIFARLWLVDDEIVGSDFTPAYRRLLPTIWVVVL